MKAITDYMRSKTVENIRKMAEAGVTREQIQEHVGQLDLYHFWYGMGILEITDETVEDLKFISDYEEYYPLYTQVKLNPYKEYRLPIKESYLLLVCKNKLREVSRTVGYERVAVYLRYLDELLGVLPFLQVIQPEFTKESLAWDFQQFKGFVGGLTDTERVKLGQIRHEQVDRLHKGIGRLSKYEQGLYANTYFEVDRTLRYIERLIKEG